jgi:SAM-dependent methyltransferase
MTLKVQPPSPELRDFYSARTAWRSAGEERMRFRKATALARVPAGAAVLDIGARDGGLRAFLPPSVQYQGIDIAPEFARPDVLIRDISQGIPFPDRSYDFVFCIEVLEHVPNPFATLAEFHRVLKPGGALILSVPNPYHFKEIIWNLFRIPDRQGHIYGWTRQTMTRLGEMNGFRLERSGGTYLHPPIPIWALLARSIVYRFVKT